MPQTTRTAIPEKAFECTCLRVRKAARRLSQIYDRHLDGSGLTITQFSLLGHLRAFDGIGISALADKLVMDASTLTRNLRPLEKRGLIVQRADAADRRNRRLSLTREGHAAFAVARPRWELAQREVAAAIGGDAGRQLAYSLDDLLARLPG